MIDTKTAKEAHAQHLNMLIEGTVFLVLYPLAHQPEGCGLFWVNGQPYERLCSFSVSAPFCVDRAEKTNQGGIDQQSRSPTFCRASNCYKVNVNEKMHTPHTAHVPFPLQRFPRDDRRCMCGRVPTFRSTPRCRACEDSCETVAA